MVIRRRKTVPTFLPVNRRMGADLRPRNPDKSLPIPLEIWSRRALTLGVH